MSNPTLIHSDSLANQSIQNTVNSENSTNKKTLLRTKNTKTTKLPVNQEQPKINKNSKVVTIQAEVITDFDA